MPEYVSVHCIRTMSRAGSVDVGYADYSTAVRRQLTRIEVSHVLYEISTRVRSEREV